MIIEKFPCKIRDLIKGYVDDDENGCRAMSGRLDVRPPYQREFIYSMDKQQKVIDTIIKNYPLNVFYWGTTEVSGYMSLVDGQQRTVSICRFVRGEYSIRYNGNDCIFSGLPITVQNDILNYDLDVYKCSGTEDEMLAWFETINIASEPLTTQELRNAVYTGAWLTDAKRYFSKTNCPAVNVGREFVRGVPNRQEILEEVLRWVADSKGLKIAEYMGVHRNDSDAMELWTYFQTVIKWVKDVFGVPTKESGNVRWGVLYNKYAEASRLDEDDRILCTIDGVERLYTKAELRREVERLQDDDEVTSRQGIYEYVLSGDEKKLSIRKFPDKIKMKKWKQQGGKCAICSRNFEVNDMMADHILPWSKGGKTVEGNCQVLCVECNLKKSSRTELAIDEVACSRCGKSVKRGMFCQFCGTKN